MTPAPSRVAAILVNFRTGRAAVEALAANLDLCDRVLVVENGSGAHEAGLLTAAFPRAASRKLSAGSVLTTDRAALLVLPENRGYCEGNNVGVRVARELWPDVTHFLIANPDAIVPPRALGRALEIMREPRAGVVALATQRPTTASRGLAAQKYLGYYPRRPRRIADDVEERGVVSGFAVLVAVECVADIEAARGGLFLDSIFICLDEMELGWTLVQRGWRLFLVFDSSVGHRGGESMDRVRLPIREYYSTRNVHFLARAVPRLRGLWMLLWSLGWSATECAVHFVRRDRARASAVAQGWWDGLRRRGGRWRRQN